MVFWPSHATASAWMHWRLPLVALIDVSGLDRTAPRFVHRSLTALAVGLNSKLILLVLPAWQQFLRHEFDQKRPIFMEKSLPLLVF